MAIQKNFVVRHGLEVATDLILADAVTGKVGIASTGPRTELDVRGGIAATDLTIVGVATINTLKVATGIITDLQGTNLNYSGVSTITNAGITNLNVSGIATATLLNVINNATIAVGIVTHLSGTNLNYSGIGTIENLNSTNLTISGFSTFNSYADFNGGIVADQLNVTGVSTLSTVDINAGDIEVTSVITSDLDVTGIATIATVDINAGDIEVTSIRSVNSNTSGIATIATVDINAGDIEVTSVRTSNLNATGVTTIASLSVTGSIFDTLIVNNFSTLNGVTTVTNAEITNLNVTGIATISTIDLNAGDLEVSNLDATDINVTGISTLSTVKISSGIITASSGIVTYYGDGAYLQNISAGIGIGTTGGLVGYAVTFINFYGTGVSTALYDSSAGIATIFFEGGGSGTIGIGTEFPPSLNSNGDLFYNANYGRLFVYYDESVIGVGTDAFWVDAAPFNVGIITGLTNVSFYPGSVSSPSIYIIGDNQTGLFSPSSGNLTFVSVGSSVLNINSSGVNVTGIATATDFDSLSDIRYKKNISTVESALSKVDQLRGVKFNWKESGLPSYGVIAQELEEVLPELVHGEDPKTVNYNGIIGVLIESIKELKAEIKEIKNTK